MHSKLALSIVSGIALTFCQMGQARDFVAAISGEYIVTGSGSCITAPPGAFFDPVTLAAPPGSTVANFTVQAKRVFNGDGTGQDSGISVNVNVPNAFGFNGGASSSNFSGPFTYTVDAGLNITMVQAPFYSTVLSGFGIGTTSLISGVPAFKGRISEDLSTIIAHHETPGVETITGPGPNGSTLIRQRICVRERTATRLKRGHDE